MDFGRKNKVTTMKFAPFRLLPCVDATTNTFDTQMFIWQINVLRAQFDDEEYTKKEKLYWKIEYKDSQSSLGKTKEFTPASRKKPAWNYFTEIRDEKAINSLHFTLFSKNDGNQQSAQFSIDLKTLRRSPDREHEAWYEIQDNTGSRIVGKLHVEITYKSYVIDGQSSSDGCTNMSCTGPGGEECNLMQKTLEVLRKLGSESICYLNEARRISFGALVQRCEIVHFGMKWIGSTSNWLSLRQLAGAAQRL